MASTHAEVLARIESLYRILFDHNGYGEMSVEIRFLRKREKEVLIRCGKQYRYVVPCDGPAGQPVAGTPAGGGPARKDLGCGNGSRAAETEESQRTGCPRREPSANAGHRTDAGSI